MGEEEMDNLAELSRRAGREPEAKGDEAVIAVELSLKQWRVIEFLARRGAVTEIDRAFLTPTSHKLDCIVDFATACRALAEKLPPQP
jgi:hypothetical protein